MPLTDFAEQILERLPGYRVEIIDGDLLVSPPRDVTHAFTLTDLTISFCHSGLHDEESFVVQNVAVRLPTGTEDYAVPDLSVVDADIEDHVAEGTVYDPVSFRLVLEVTSHNWRNDLKIKPGAYASAEIPVYVVVDRKHHCVHLFTDPADGGYRSHRSYAPGETVTLPASIGAEVTLDVDQILEAGR